MILNGGTYFTGTACGCGALAGVAAGFAGAFAKGVKRVFSWVASCCTCDPAWLAANVLFAQSSASGYLFCLSSATVKRNITYSSFGVVCNALLNSCSLPR